MSQRPTGTVTFLFTDIEGSTQLWEQHPDSMGDAIARHDALLREAIEAHGGYVFKTVGDAFCAAFSSPSEAIAAAAAAQRSLCAEEWTDTEPLRVRMSLHSGESEERAGDYFGTALNRCARLLDIGHGGQVLLSLVTEELVRDSLPDGMSLLDLGAHRLRDLGRPEPTYQVIAPGIPDRFPALVSLDAFTHNLPVQASRFIGRRQQLVEVKRLLGETRLLTLTGVGGCGKSRLALQVAADVLHEYPDGVWQTELAPLDDPSVVPHAVATVLGLREEPGRDIVVTLTEYLSHRRLLLILDNCEHLLEACARFAESTSRTSDAVRVLVTSREALGIPGETVWSVPMLSIPEAQWQPTTDKDAVQSLSQYEAVQLFVDRASQARPEFTVTNDSAPAVAEVCHRLDGIALAIELAASRVRHLSIDQLMARLDQRFRLLTGGSRTAPPRQKTLLATIDWSHDLLDEAEQTFFRRLSVFRGGWSLDAAEAVYSEAAVRDCAVLDLLGHLVDCSLVEFEQHGSAGRYHMLETVSEYARSKLADSGELEIASGEHLAYFTALAEQAQPHLSGAEQVQWLDRLDDDWHNLRRAVEWGASNGGDSVMAMTLCGMLPQYLLYRGKATEGRSLLASVLASSAEAPASVRFRALYVSAVLADCSGDYESASAFLEDSLPLARQLGDLRAVTQTLSLLGNLRVREGDLDRAQDLYEECLANCRALDDEQGVGAIAQNLAAVARDRGDLAMARDLLEESVAISRRHGNELDAIDALCSMGEVVIHLGDQATARAYLEESLDGARRLQHDHVRSRALEFLGLLALEDGEFDKARDLYQECLTVCEDLGDPQGAACALVRLGAVEMSAGDHARARTLFKDGLELLRRLGIKRLLPMGLESVAELDSMQGQSSRAVRIRGAADGIREEIGVPAAVYDREGLVQTVDAAKANLGDEAFSAAWALGKVMSADEAVDYALGETAWDVLAPVMADRIAAGEATNSQREEDSVDAAPDRAGAT